ncbi:Hsp70 suppressor, GTPase facilitates ribosomal subunit dissociation [Xylographa opegraphella]|nr:Hsp70 suppressor, GTPase facilitates ribosomal subunit dissociation [Xylographa opegraphella]
MSRHKLVKNMNLDDELDDFDGGYDYDYEEGGGGDELSAEDKVQMQEGTAQVRSIVGPEVAISDKDIQDSLWHYYYDVEKTVTYLLNQRSNVEPRKATKTGEGSGKKAKDPTMSPEDMSSADSCTQAFSARDFFKDCPWLEIPLERQAVILIEPLYPRGRLLGGSGETAPKVSKLAALAAARKKRENEKLNGLDSTPVTSSTALLDKLKIGDQNEESKRIIGETNARSGRTARFNLSHTASTSQPTTKEGRKYPAKNPIAPPEEGPPPQSEEASTPVEDIPESPPAHLASPSIFARTMFGSTRTPIPLTNPSVFFNPYTLNITESDPFAGPSPDDVVANAQNSSKGMKGSKTNNKSTNSDKSVDGVAEGISRVSIDANASHAKSKNLNVIAEYRKSEKKKAANFVVIGHVDAGKSTLLGRLLLDLHVVDQRLVDKYRKEAEAIGKSSFALAWVLDQGTEERNRGVTIDIASNKFETDTTTFTILDAPGHRDFIPNMIAGASQADFAVLVIDASTGSFESGLKGQTKEHALLVRSMGVQRLIVAVNKLDTVSWSRDRFDEIQQQVSAFLTAAGFQSRNVSFLPCSGLTGANIVSRSADPDAAWYTGPVLIQQLETSEPFTRALEKPLRLPIDDISRTNTQSPLSVSGRLEAGSIQIGDKILAIPSGESAFVKALDVDSEPADWAVAGQNVTLHLSDIDAAHLKHGDVLCSPSAPIQSVKSFRAKILAFEHVTPMHLDVHRGRLHAPGRVTRLVGVLDKSSGMVVRKKPRLVKPGEVARVVVELDVEGGVPLEAGMRVVLRAGGETVAAGLVE